MQKTYIERNSTLNIEQAIEKQSFHKGVIMSQQLSKDKPLLSHISSVPIQPLFIMGVQRSGTSILYKLLQKTGFFTVTTAYHIICFDELLFNYFHDRESEVKQNLSKQLLKNEQTHRGIDELSIDVDFPEEYGFLLSRKSGLQRLHSTNISIFHHLCQKVCFLANNKKPILLKNPFDFTQFLYIKEQFPDAKFIFIHRHPLYTLSSQLNAMYTLFQKKSKYMALLSPWYHKTYHHPILRRYYQLASSPRNPLRVHHLIKNLSMVTSTFIQDINRLTNHIDYISIRYEDLCDNPQQTMKDVLHFLGFSINDSLDFSTDIKPRNRPIRKQIKKHKEKIKNLLD